MTTDVIASREREDKMQTTMKMRTNGGGKNDLNSNANGEMFYCSAFLSFVAPRQHVIKGERTALVI